MIRMCLSGDPACTGIAPCDACEKALYERVLPRAMVAGGFNGSVEIATRFFEGFKEAHDRLRQQAPNEMAEAMKTAQGQKEEPAAEMEEEERESEPELVTEDEISAMAKVEDFIEPEVKKATPREMARLARRLKAKRAAKKKEKEGTHGKEEGRSDV